jgi:hypothetical protein
MEQLIEWELIRETGVLWENPIQCHYRSHMTFPGMEPGPPRWDSRCWFKASWNNVQKARDEQLYADRLCLKWHVGLTVVCCRTSVLGPYQPRMEPLQQGEETVACQPGAQQAAVRPQPQAVAYRQTQSESFTVTWYFELHSILHQKAYSCPADQGFPSYCDLLGYDTVS